MPQMIRPHACWSITSQNAGAELTYHTATTIATMGPCLLVPSPAGESVSSNIRFLSNEGALCEPQLPPSHSPTAGAAAGATEGAAPSVDN
jgi:hypothetical protein